MKIKKILVFYLKINMSFTTINTIPRNYPPIVGEFSYFYSKDIDNKSHYLVKVFADEENQEKKCFCHFSSPINLNNVPYYTNSGIIKSIDKEIVKNWHKRLTIDT